jgi:hypothetical protein
MYVLAIPLVVFVLWIAYHFVRGFIQGLRGETRPALKLFRGDDDEKYAEVCSPLAAGGKPSGWIPPDELPREFLPALGSRLL